MMALMDNLRDIREAHAMSVKELAELSGISWRYIYYLENGRRRNPSTKTLIALSQALDTSVDSIVRS